LLPRIAVEKAERGVVNSLKLKTESVSGGVFRLDFGIVFIDLSFGDVLGLGPSKDAWICGENGCIVKNFGPLTSSSALWPPCRKAAIAPGRALHRGSRAGIIAPALAGDGFIFSD